MRGLRERSERAEGGGGSIAEGEAAGGQGWAKAPREQSSRVSARITIHGIRGRLLVLRFVRLESLLELVQELARKIGEARDGRPTRNGPVGRRIRRRAV